MQILKTEPALIAVDMPVDDRPGVFLDTPIIPGRPSRNRWRFVRRWLFRHQRATYRELPPTEAARAVAELAPPAGGRLEYWLAEAWIYRVDLADREANLARARRTDLWIG